MSKKINEEYFRSRRKKELNDFLTILENYDIHYNTKVFKDFPPNIWGYKIEGLTIRLESSTLKHIKPEGFVSVEAIIDLEIESQINEWENFTDPFTSLNFKSTLKGSNIKTGKTHYFGFHIDRHNDLLKTNEIHPLYHLHYLQNTKESHGTFDYGDSFQLDIPRLMHFPMELVLGVNYLLSNFSPQKYEQIIQDRQYLNIYKEYQEKVWRPYIRSLGDFWAMPTNWIWNPQLNCPYLK